MTEVFISYRKENDAQCQRVRGFAEKLRDSGITVILDQFYMDDHPGGSSEIWAKWSSDRAINTEKVLIIGSEARCLVRTALDDSYRLDTLVLKQANAD